MIRRVLLALAVVVAASGCCPRRAQSPAPGPEFLYREISTWNQVRREPELELLRTMGGWRCRLSPADNWSYGATIEEAYKKAGYVRLGIE